MPPLPHTFAEDVIAEPLRVQLETFLDEHQAALGACLDGLTEEQAAPLSGAVTDHAARSVKHATFVEKVGFDEAITCPTGH